MIGILLKTVVLEAQRRKLAPSSQCTQVKAMCMERKEQRTACESNQTLKYLFLQKVPPSGGPPAFKLTLPHQVVHRHLLHLVDTDFDLAPSATAEQTWQGSIAPRRNKERSEYTLQVHCLSLLLLGRSRTQQSRQPCRNPATCICWLQQA